ncbi:MAG TPA: hypothetical protein VGB53_08125, partial [Rubricoccaceae bacterium]
MRTPLVLLVLGLALLGAAPPAHAQPRAAPTPAGIQAEAEGHLVRSLTALALGKDSAAVRHAEAALALAPGSAAPLDLLAEAYEALGRPTDALYHAGLAAAAAPGEAGVAVRLARLQAASGQAAAALATAERARRLSPADAESLALVARLYAAAGRPADERAALEDLAARYGDPAVWQRLAALYDRTGATDQALAARRTAGLAETAASAPAASPPGYTAPPPVLSADAALAIVADDPRRLDAWAAALTALATSGDPRAGDTADEATLLFPTLPAILAPAAEAYLAAGRPADAARAARAGLAAL